MEKVVNRYKEEIIDPGDQVSKVAHGVCVDSYNNNSAVIIKPRQEGNFRGAVDFNWHKKVSREMAKGRINQTIQNDGAGGKPQFFTLVGTEEVFFNLGWEIITMCADDIVRSGGFPAVMVNEVQTKKITKENFHLFNVMMWGYGYALKQAKLVNITGEVAVMKHSITAFCDQNSDSQLILTWGGTCFGLSPAGRIIDGSKIKPGMPIVGFYEPGYRCNGGTFFTNLILKEAKNNLGYIFKNPRLMKFIKKLTVPSKSYARLIARAHGWEEDGTLKKEAPIKMAGIAHITGGGVWGKFREILPAGVGAKLDKMPKPAKVLLEAQEMSWDIPELRLTDLQAYGTLHGGCGMLVVCETEDDVRSLIKLAPLLNIRANLVGETIESANREIIIRSRFKEGRTLSSKELEE